MAGNRFSVTVQGMEKLSKIPGWLEDGQREFLSKGAGRVADEIAKAAPGGKSGRIGRSVGVDVLSDTKAQIEVRHPAARALERGAYIRPKKGKALRFRIGGRVVFTRKGVKIPAFGYAKKGLKNRGRIMRDAYGEAFDDLERL